MTKKVKALIRKYKRFIIFVIIGGVNTATDFLVFTAAGAFTPLAVEYCQAIGYAAGIVCSYILNRTITFRDAEKGDVFLKVLRFLLVNAVSLGVGMYGIRLLAKYLNKYLAKIIVTCATIVINYFGYKIIVFKVKGSKGEKRV